MKVKYLDLKNKRVFISGGGSGIGASIVEHFCEQNSEAVSYTHLTLPTNVAV